LKSAHAAKAGGVLRRLTLEGKLLPRDPQEAVRLIGMAGTWHLDAHTEVLKILAANADVRVDRPGDTLYYAMEAAELASPAQRPR